MDYKKQLVDLKQSFNYNFSTFMKIKSEVDSEVDIYHANKTKKKIKKWLKKRKK